MRVVHTAKIVLATVPDLPHPGRVKELVLGANTVKEYVYVAPGTCQGKCDLLESVFGLDNCTRILFDAFLADGFREVRVQARNRYIIASCTKHNCFISAGDDKQGVYFAAVVKRVQGR